MAVGPVQQRSSVQSTTSQAPAKAPAPKAPPPKAEPQAVRQDASGDTVRANRDRNRGNELAQRTRVETQRTPEAVSQRQARADVDRLNREFGDPKTWDADKTARYAERTRDLVKQHPGDRAYADAVVDHGFKGLEKAAQFAGDRAHNGVDDSDKKNGPLAKTVGALSDITAATSPDRTQRVANAIADRIPNKSELNQLDDRFYDHRDNGGSTALMDATTNALRSQGKNEAADELQTKHEGGGGFGISLPNPVDVVNDVKDKAVDLGKGAVGGLKDLGGAAVGTALDVGGEAFKVVENAGKGVLKVAGKGGELVVDTAKKSVDLAGDVAGKGLDAVESGLKFAAEKGLQVTGALRGKAQELFDNTVLSPLKIDDNISKLKPGDEYTIKASGDVALGVSGAAAGEIKVSRGQDGKYTVQGSAELDVGLKLGGKLGVSGKGTVEYKFDNPQDAAEASRILIRQGAAAGAAGVPGLGTVMAGVLTPGAKEQSFLNQHRSALELSAKTGTGVDVSSGFGADSVIAKAGAGAEAAIRVNFENGRPVSLTTKSEASAGAELTHDSVIPQGKLQNGQLPDIGGQASIKATQETTARLKDGIGVDDVVQLALSKNPMALTDPRTAVTTNKVEVDVHGEVGGKDKGVKLELQVQNSPQDFVNTVRDLVTGNPNEALQRLQKNSSGTLRSYSEEGFHERPQFKLLGQGLGFEFQNERRHYDTPVTF
ncbi:MAG: hypothetical protein AB2A00_17010 [Myxococcota bacterium]